MVTEIFMLQSVDVYNCLCTIIFVRL